MERLNLIKNKKSNILYTRKTADKALENVLKKINEVNKNEDLIYEVKKAVLFGSYINSEKEKIGDIDIAIYMELKDNTTPEIEQNIKRSSSANYNVPFLLKFFYGKIEIFKIIRDRKRVIQLHDGFKVDSEAKECGDIVSYIYFDKNQVIFEEV